MNTKLSAASDKRMDLTCSACGQEFSYKIAHLILATRDKTTTHEVRQIARCHNCAVKGNKGKGEEPGGARRSQEEPGGARRSQEEEGQGDRRGLVRAPWVPQGYQGASMGRGPWEPHWSMEPRNF